MQSAEYPDLPWMEPKSWTDANRSSVQLIVIHTTEGSAHSGSAEDGAAYDQRRTDGTSTHFFHDSDSTIQCVRTADQAHAARAQGNKRGIQHELCTKAGSANWSDSYHQKMLRLAARQAARDARKWGIPVKRLSSDQVAAGQRGFCGHVEITYAFPQDNGTHTDPGKSFPWSQFLDMVNEEMDDGMSEQDAYDGATRAMKDFFAVTKQPSGHPESKIGHDASAQGVPNTIDGGTITLYGLLGKIGTHLMDTKRMVSELAGKDFTDEQAIISGVLAGLAGAEGAAETIADAVVNALPPDLAQQVVDEMAIRLAPQS